MAALILSIGLASCATNAQKPPEASWYRTDGRPAGETPPQEAQFEVDKVICEGEMQKANLSGTQFCRGVADCIISSSIRGDAMGTVGKGCMAQKGYVLITDDQATGLRAAMATAPATPASKARK